MKKGILYLWICGFVFIFIGCASSPRAKRVEAVKNLQDEVDGLKKDRADLNVKLDDLKTEVQILSGKLEENQHFLKKISKRLEDNNQRLDTVIADYDKKIGGLEDSTQETQKGLEDIRQKVSSVEERLEAKKASSPTAGVDIRYDYLNGVKKLKEKDYNEAILLFSRYNKNFSKGRMIENSMFFLGEAHLEKKDYQNAILKYEEYKEKFPSGKRVSEAIFKQALSFKGLGKTSDAKLFLEDIITNHASSEFAGKAKTELKNLK